MKTEIRSISEAFSMQPNTFTVVDKKPDNPKWPVLNKIILETKQISIDNMVSIYVGYDFDSNKMFEYLANTVNVHYKS